MDDTRQAYKCQCKCQCQNGMAEKGDKDTNNVSQIWLDFLRDTTFHGCRNIEKRGRTALYRLLWTVMVLGMLGGLMYLVVQSLINYFEYRVITNSKIQVHREMPFPAVTVCSVAPINIANKNMSQTLIDYFGRLTLLGKLLPPQNWSDLASRELDHTALNDVVDEFTFSDVDKFIIYKQWPGSGNITFKTVYTYSGKCYVANNNSTQQAKSTIEGRTGGLQLVMNLEEDGVILQADMTHGAKVFVHDPRDKARTLESGVMVAPGNSVYINLKPTKYNFLPAPYKSYGDSYCIETDDTYSYEACVSDWFSTKTAMLCNCTTLVEPRDVQEKLPNCSLKQFEECYLGSLRKFRAQVRNEDFTACPKPCSFTRYETSVSFSKFPSEAAAEKMFLFARMYANPLADVDYVRRNALKVTIYFDRFLMEHVVYVPEVTLNSIFSILGGQMGLFLGASLLTVVELGEALIMSFWTYGQRMTGSMNRRKIKSHH